MGIHNMTKFLLNCFLQCKDIFLNDYDGIYNCNGLEYGTYEIFDTFLFISCDVDENIREKNCGKN